MWQLCDQASRPAGTPAIFWVHADRLGTAQKMTDATGAVVEENLPEAGRIAMQPGNARLLREMLTSVTEEGGTGTSAAIPGVRVAVKTGTAQKANESRRGYDDSRWVSSFIGFAPANQPRLVITVVIDEPQMSHAGGEIAAPLFRRVMEQSLRYLGALPATARTAAEPAPRGASSSSAPSCRFCRKRLTAAADYRNRGSSHYPQWR